MTRILTALLFATPALAAEVDYDKKAIHLRVAWAGTKPDRALANLKHIHAKTAAPGSAAPPPASRKADAYWILPVRLGDIRGFSTHFQLVTLPRDPAARAKVLAGIDAVVFVADGGAKDAGANARAFQQLTGELEAAGFDWEHRPFVIQVEKPGMVAAASYPSIAGLELKGKPVFAADANKGDGVFDTFKQAAKLALTALRDEHQH